MSCGNPAADPDALMERRLKFDRSNMCIRCKESIGNIVIRHAVYCKNCFIPFLTHKFRRSLEPTINPTGNKRTILKPAGNLLLGFSGGLGSTTLLDLVHRCYYSEDGKLNNQHKVGKDRSHNNVWEKVSVCFVEVFEAYPGMRDRTSEIREVMKNYPEFELITLRLSHAFDNAWWEGLAVKDLSRNFTADLLNEDLLLSSSRESRSPSDALSLYLKSLPTQTSLQSTIQNIIRVLLLQTALRTESSHLLLGTSLTSLAISLISSIAQGGGFTVREEAQEDWVPTSGKSVRIVRPLRDLGMKECAAHAWWKQLSVVGKEKWPNAKQSIGGLTKEFIVGLEKDYPSTVSTITRTCAKLEPKDESTGRCMLCERPAQSGLQEWKSRISIRSLDPPKEPVPSSFRAALAPHLCYACYTTLTSKSSRGMMPGNSDASEVALPVWSQFRLENGAEIWRGAKMESTQMKSLVGEFLLDSEV